MIVNEVVEYWNDFIIENDISDKERVIVLDDAYLLDNVLLYMGFFSSKENCISPVLAFPTSLVVNRTLESETLCFDERFFNGLMSLPSNHQLRERLIVCSFHEDNIEKIIGTYVINSKCTEVSVRDIVAQGMMALYSTPSPEEIEEKKRINEGFSRRLDWKLLKPFLPKRNIDSNYFDFALNNTKKLVERGTIDKTNTVYLFGKTKTTLLLYKYFISRGIVIEAILDNKASDNELYEGISVISPRDIQDIKNKSNIRIIISLISYIDVCKQLYSYGYDFGTSLFVVSGVKKTPLIEAKELEQTSVIQSDNACKSIDELKQKYKNEIVNICPYKGAGDVYLICRYLQIDQRLNNEKHIIVVSSTSLKKVAGILSIDAEVLPREEIINMSEWFPFCETENVRLLDINITTSIGQRLHGINGLDYNVMLHRMLFRNLPYDFEVDIYQEEDKSITNNYVLDSDRTVIISPYASTVRLELEELWIDIVKLLKQKGYIVYTNVSGDEKPIDGTEGISIPFTSLIWSMNQCKAFIGLRSGLCDVISTTTCKMVIIYNGQLANSTTYFQLYSLRAMGIRDDNLLEIDYQDGQNYDEIIKAVEVI